MLVQALVAEKKIAPSDISSTSWWQTNRTIDCRPFGVLYPAEKIRREADCSRQRHGRTDRDWTSVNFEAKSHVRSSRIQHFRVRLLHCISRVVFKALASVVRSKKILSFVCQQRRRISHVTAKISLRSWTRPINGNREMAFRLGSLGRGESRSAV